MKNSSSKKILTRILFIFSVLFIVMSIVLYAGLLPIPVLHFLRGIIDQEFASGLGGFYLELVGTTVGVSSSLLIICVFLLQQKQTRITQVESNFYKMLDFHRDNVNRIVIQDYKLYKKEKVEKSQAFVTFKL